MNSILNTLQNSINELENIYNNILQNKEELTINIQKIFTKLKAALNKREDEIILDIENKYSESFFDEDIIKQSKKLPEKIKVSLDKTKIIEEKWKNNEELCFAINDSLEIEKDNAKIREINESINKCNGLIVNIYFRPNKKGVMELMDSINKFGSVEIYRGNNNEDKKEDEKEDEKKGKKGKKKDKKKGKKYIVDEEAEFDLGNIFN